MSKKNNYHENHKDEENEKEKEGHESREIREESNGIRSEALMNDDDDDDGGKSDNSNNINDLNSNGNNSKSNNSKQSKRSNSMSNNSRSNNSNDNSRHSNKSTLSKLLNNNIKNNDNNKYMNKIIENQDDDKISTTSSELSYHQNEMTKSGIVAKCSGHSNKFTADRNQMKLDYFDNVVDEMLDVINDYKINIDINHAAMADKRTEKNHYQFVNDIIHYAKILGFWKYNLHELVIYERIEVIDARLHQLTTGKKAQPALINQYDTEGHTPLSIAIKTNRRDVSFSLLSKGASPDIYDESTGRTPLYYSVFHGFYKISKDLIGAGANINLG